ncbi:MAG: hypothetical protein JOY78_11115 [Pseudonocardia sp.]|nr:hypothetical protein [Pseudonocardia sp.]
MPHPAAPRAAGTGSNRVGAGTTGSNRAGLAPSSGSTTGAERADTAANQYGAYPPAAGPFGGHGAGSTTGANRVGATPPAAGSFGGHASGVNTGADPAPSFGGHTGGANQLGGPPGGGFGGHAAPSTTGVNQLGANPSAAGSFGHATGANRLGLSGANPGGPVNQLGASTPPYGTPTDGAATARPVDSPWGVDRQASQPLALASESAAGQPAASTGARYPAPPDLSGAPATIGWRSRSEVPQTWAHASGGHLASRPGIPAVDASAASAQPIPSWELSRPPVTPPVRAPITETVAWDQAPFDPDALPMRAAAPDRGTGPFDPLVDPLPVLDPLPEPEATWTEAARAEASGRYDAASTRRDRSAPPVTGAAEPRWLAADLLQNRDRSPSRWRAADLLAGRDRTDRAPASDSASMWRAADLLADRYAGHADAARGVDPSTGRGPAREGSARLPRREADDAGGNRSAASRWLAADLLNGREGRVATDRDDPEPSRWLAADLLNRRSGIDSSEHGRQAPSARTPEGQHLRSEATSFRWQAADLLAYRNDVNPGRRAVGDRQGGHDDSSPRMWRAAELLEREREVSSPGLDDAAPPWGEEPKFVGRAERRRRSEAAREGAGRRSPVRAETGREGPSSHAGDEPSRHEGGSRHDATPPRMPPTQWAWPKDPEPAPSEFARARRAGVDAWSAADLLDEGRHGGGRRRARESARHDAPAHPHDDDAGRHYRP